MLLNVEQPKESYVQILLTAQEPGGSRVNSFRWRSLEPGAVCLNRVVRSLEGAVCIQLVQMLLNAAEPGGSRVVCKESSVSDLVKRCNVN